MEGDCTQTEEDDSGSENSLTLSEAQMEQQMKRTTVRKKLEQKTEEVHGNATQSVGARGQNILTSWAGAVGIVQGSVLDGRLDQRIYGILLNKEGKETH